METETSLIIGISILAVIIGMVMTFVFYLYKWNKMVKEYLKELEEEKEALKKNHKHKRNNEQKKNH